VARPPVSIDVQMRLGGAAPAAGALGPLRLDLFEEQLTLSALIRSTVEEQVRELRMRHALDWLAIAAVLDRHYLTEAEVAAQAANAGAVRLPSRQPGPLDAELEVRRALAAFERGVVAVFVDGRQLEQLDEVITVRPGTRVVFLRLMPLAGGA